MEFWQLDSLALEPHSPKILSSTSAARTILVNLPEGEALEEHEVHERAFVILVSGQAEVTTPAGDTETGGAGLMIEFAPGERHAVRALSDVRLLLVLAPWPGAGHPGALTLDEKAAVRDRAAEQEIGTAGQGH
ncbi:MAG: hypothetical protein QOG62_346 [Thermoleophilaceae bacterium]|jgi:quercetin dioxygenase-like cupin family protein|nr:hypothetical protein [Thermoleophilaceae bacterium]